MPLNTPPPPTRESPASAPDLTFTVTEAALALSALRPKAKRTTIAINVLRDVPRMLPPFSRNSAKPNRSAWGCIVPRGIRIYRHQRSVRPHHLWAQSEQLRIAPLRH